MECRYSMKQEEIYKIRDWVEELPKKGIITFSVEEVYKLFPSISKRGNSKCFVTSSDKRQNFICMERILYYNTY